MNIGKKVILYFSFVTITLVGTALIFIYTLFHDYHKDDFRQQQKEKIVTSLKLLTEIEGVDDAYIGFLNKITFDDLSNEGLLILDREKNLIYSSLDTTPKALVPVIEELSPSTQWIEKEQGSYDVIGVVFKNNNQTYYGVSKAKDITGIEELKYLRFVLLLTFLGITVIVIIVSIYLSKKITRPIVALTQKIKEYNFEEDYHPIAISETKNEVAVLAQRFNELMKRMNEAFSFQKHAVHHISHELKTPIAILVSNFERIEQEKDINKIRSALKNQKEDTESLGKIIHSMLEIAKTESGNADLVEIRIDELIFDLVHELGILHPDFKFSIEFSNEIQEEQNLKVLANYRLLKAAFSNVMLNCIQYSDDHQAEVYIEAGSQKLQANFMNKGILINENEKQYLFKHFFRGENSKGKRGFGLGLVFIKKILKMYNGEILYSSKGQKNTFAISIPFALK
jgi:signal transduction histidine kinase